MPTDPEQTRAEPTSEGQDAEPDGRADTSTVQRLAAEVADLRDRWQRAAADLDNARKRHAKELARAAAAERSTVTAAWLPVVDDLERALAHADADPAAIVAGVRAVHDQAVDLLARLGYPRQDEVGVPFDPGRHEVVTVVDEPDTGPGTVVRVLRPGYGEADHQLRPQAVAVSRPAE
jgi:molecular chaperone GrpE